MKTSVLFIVMLLVTSGYVHASNVTHIDRLIPALIQVESSGNDKAIGDRQKKFPAYGPLQIRQPCVDDVNRRHGTKIKAEELLGNRKLSMWVCAKYLEMYGTPKNIKRKPGLEDLARIWNGGPCGWKSNATLGYWVKVKKNLK